MNRRPAGVVRCCDVLILIHATHPRSGQWDQDHVHSYTVLIVINGQSVSCYIVTIPIEIFNLKSDCYRLLVAVTVELECGISKITFEGVTPSSCGDKSQQTVKISHLLILIETLCKQHIGFL